MKSVIFFLAMVVSSMSVYASNIAIIDGSGSSTYLDSKGDQILTARRCFSEKDVTEKAVGSYGSDPNISEYTLYYQASGCPNGTAFDTKIGDRKALRAKRKSGSDLYSTLSGTHLSSVTDVALQTTSQSILAISVPRYVSKGGTPFSPFGLEEEISPDGLNKGLDYVLNNHKRLNIRVVNLSLGGLFIEGHGLCDSINLPPRTRNNKKSNYAFN